MRQLEYVMRFLNDLEKHFDGMQLTLSVHSKYVRLQMNMFQYVSTKTYEYVWVCDSFPGSVELVLAGDVRSFYMDVREVILNDEGRSI